MSSVSGSTLWNSNRPLLPQTTTVFAAHHQNRDRRGWIVLAVVSLALLSFLLISPIHSQQPATKRRCGGATPSSGYDATYPLTQPWMTDGSTRFKLKIIADLDKASRDEAGKRWISHLYSAELVRDARGKYSVDLHKDVVTLSSQISEKGRGLELSELQYFNGKLLSVDDRTGVVYEILNNEAIPRYILTDGDGDVAKGFKAEWMTVKDRKLWIGGMGKEWTTPRGEVINLHPQWVKTVTANGVVKHVSWVKNYNALRNAAKMPPPGYILHESAAWSNVHNAWFFLPRHASAEAYDDEKDELRGSNMVLRADADFENVQVSTVGTTVPAHGFSSFKFVPGTEDRHIVALKTQELQGVIASYMLVYDVTTGEELMPEVYLSGDKLEGVEFV